MFDHLYLAHHGIKGMHWGIRRFQNADGSLTSAGKKRYSIDGGWNPKTQQPKRMQKGMDSEGVKPKGKVIGANVHVLNPNNTMLDARHIIEDGVSRDEISRAKDIAAVKKHVTFNKDGKVTGISKELERYFGVPLSDIDDEDFVVYQAMVLEALKEY